MPRPSKVAHWFEQASLDAVQLGVGTGHLDEIFGSRSAVLRSPDAAVAGFLRIAHLVDTVPNLRCSMAFSETLSDELQCEPPPLNALRVSVAEAPVVYLYPASSFGDHPGVMEVYRFPYQTHPWPGRNLAVEFESSKDPATPWEYRNVVNVYYTHGRGVRI
jgi:hypothetical protein